MVEPENNPGALSTGLSAGARAGTCERIRKREVEAAVEDALVAFCGTRRNPLFDRDRAAGPATGTGGTSALERVRRQLPHALETLKLIIRNRDNRKESICSLVKSQLSTRRNGNSRGRSTTETSAPSPGSSPASR